MSVIKTGRWSLFRIGEVKTAKQHCWFCGRAERGLGINRVALTDVKQSILEGIVKFVDDSLDTIVCLCCRRNCYKLSSRVGQLALKRATSKAKAIL